MLLTTTLLPLFLSSLATASFFSGSQQPLSPNREADLAVPGENPLEYCAATDAYTLAIEKVDLVPNPPLPGATLTIIALGEFTQEVAEGAYINISVKYGLIKILTTTLDLCEQMQNVDEKCPLKGKKVITKDVELPKEIPPGTYTVLADVYTVDDEPITCLTATVTFKL